MFKGVKKKVALVMVGLVLVVWVGSAVFAQERGATTSWISDADLWKWTQLQGKRIVLNWQGEDSPPAAAVVDLLPEFEKLTGIKVEITRTMLSTLIQKLLLDFTTRTGKIQAFHADPYQTQAPLAGHMADLRKFMQDPSLPPLPLGKEDFTEMNWIGNAYMIDDERVLAIPFGGCQYGLFYRKDVFENPRYKDLFMREMGYDWTPGPQISWAQYYEISEWINEKVREGIITEVEWGTGHQAKMYDSLMCDFSNVLAAFGGDYFKGNPVVGTYGTDLPGHCTLDEPEAIEAAQFYKKLIDIAAPGSTTWDWSGVHDAFAGGRIALAPNWFDFAPWCEDPQTSKVAGKVGYTILPHGPTGSSFNIWGGYGLGINRYASEVEQRASWLFTVWASCPAIQIEGSVLGYMPPTRISVFEDPALEEKLPPALVETVRAAEEAYKPENIYLRPKIPQWLEGDTLVYTELSKMLAGRKSPEQAMKDISEQMDKITRWAEIAPAE